MAHHDRSNDKVATDCSFIICFPLLSNDRCGGGGWGWGRKSPSMEFENRSSLWRFEHNAWLTKIESKTKNEGFRHGFRQGSGAGSGTGSGTSTLHSGGQWFRR